MVKLIDHIHDLPRCLLDSLFPHLLPLGCFLLAFISRFPNLSVQCSFDHKQSLDRFELALVEEGRAPDFVHIFLPGELGFEGEGLASEFSLWTWSCCSVHL